MSHGHLIEVTGGEQETEVLVKDLVLFKCRPYRFGQVLTVYHGSILKTQLALGSHKLGIQPISLGQAISYIMDPAALY